LWQCINERPLTLNQAAAMVATEKAVRTRLEADQAAAQMADDAKAVAESEVKKTAARRNCNARLPSLRKQPTQPLPWLLRRLLLLPLLLPGRKPRILRHWLPKLF
jgi:hypothetical protein